MKIVVSIIAERELEQEEIDALSSHGDTDFFIREVSDGFREIFIKEGATNFPRLQVYLANQ